MANGRGAWNPKGVGGTIGFSKDKPGPYYAVPTRASKLPRVGSGRWTSDDPNERAVHGGVLAFQRALNRRGNFDLDTDGIYGNETAEAVSIFQQEGVPNTTPWGGIGPDTAKAILLPDLKTRCARRGFQPVQVACGVISTESGWDAAAVGFSDPRDVGLAQINHLAHPTWTEKMRLKPLYSFDFVIDYLDNSLEAFDGDLEDAIASYNLGVGGANRWISQGRPQWYTPTGADEPRDVHKYINKILTACKGD
jgi:peptidoglycan hydrolase-like protein with peptidoglycan-binding domain